MRILTALLLSSILGGPLAAQDRLDLLSAEIDRVAPISGGILGIGIHHLETGRELYVRGDDRFPMASSFKVPVAVQLLTLVDQGGTHGVRALEAQVLAGHPYDTPEWLVVRAEHVGEKYLSWAEANATFPPFHSFQPPL